jgi:hypothetical protein
LSSRTFVTPHPQISSAPIPGGDIRCLTTVVENGTADIDAEVGGGDADLVGGRVDSGHFLCGAKNIYEVYQ